MQPATQRLVLVKSLRGVGEIVKNYVFFLKTIGKIGQTFAISDHFEVNARIGPLEPPLELLQ